LRKHVFFKLPIKAFILINIIFADKGVPPENNSRVSSTKTSKKLKFPRQWLCLFLHFRVALANYFVE